MLAPDGGIDGEEHRISCNAMEEPVFIEGEGCCNVAVLPSGILKRMGVDLNDEHCSSIRSLFALAQGLSSLLRRGNNRSKEEAARSRVITPETS
jgi:hypothetical protein